MKTRTWSIRVKNAFPADDPIAILILKLLVLREDFLLELAGMVHGVEKDFGVRELELPAVEANLDENSRSWRQLYFYRNSLRTLYEIREEINNFNSSEQGQNALTREPQSLRVLVIKLQDQMATAEKTVTRLRHNLGGHVSRNSIRSTVRDMHEDVTGFIQLGKIYGKTRYKFVGEVVMRMLLPGVREDQLLEKLDELLTTTGKLVPAFRTIDDLMGEYLLNRKLI